MPPVAPPIERPGVAAVAGDVALENDAQARFKPPARMMNQHEVTIVSIWPEELISDSRPRGGQGAYRYQIGAGTRQKPSYLRVGSTYDIVFNPASPPMAPAETTSGMIPAVIEAASLVRYWAGDHHANRFGKKGIGIIEGTVATDKELEQLERDQISWLKAMIAQADRYWRSNKPNEIEKIGKEHRKALELLRLDFKLHTWYDNVVAVYAACPRCESPIKNTSTFCIECKLDIPPYVIEEGIEIDAASLPRVAEKVAKMKKKAA